LYQAIFSISDSATFQSLAGKVTLNANLANIATQAKARVSFEEIAALETLSPFVLNAAGADGSTALQALWGSAPWIEKYQGWQADKVALQSQGTNRCSHRVDRRRRTTPCTSPRRGVPAPTCSGTSTTCLGKPA